MGATFDYDRPNNRKLSLNLEIMNQLLNYFTLRQKLVLRSPVKNNTALVQAITYVTLQKRHASN